jgi:adenylate cyclase class 2
MGKIIEIEVKYKLNNIKALFARLIENKAKNIGTEFQRTIRFDTEDKILEQSGRFLRIRSGAYNTMTLKIKNKETLDKNFNIREEMETTIGDIETIRLIILTLGFQKEYIMEKYRMNWNFIGTKIAVDEMPFGFFIEIEGEKEAITKVSKLLALDKVDRYVGTYWDLFADYQKKHGIKGDNIQFPEGYISVLNADTN